MSLPTPYYSHVELVCRYCGKPLPNASESCYRCGAYVPTSDRPKQDDDDKRDGCARG